MKHCLVTSFVLLALIAAGPALAEDAAAEGPSSAGLCAPALVGGEVSQPVWMLGECSATAECENGSTISCTASSSSETCSFADQNCAAGERGYVECGFSGEAQCPPCPIDCSNYPPRSVCKPGLACKQGCNNCGNGTCVPPGSTFGTCNCEI